MNTRMRSALLMRFHAVAVLTLVSLSTVLSQTPLFRHPQPGDIYKEYSRAMMSFSDWRVIDPNAPNATARTYLPNPVLSISIDDLAGAVRAEALIAIDMWHTGTYGKAIRFNSNAWIPISDLQTTPGPESPECYLGGMIAGVNIPLSNLKQGTNTFEGKNAGQTCYDFGWGQYGQFGIVIRIYYGSSKSHPTGSISSPTAGGTLGENPTINVATSGSVNRVDLVGYYEGYDTDGDGVYRDWHYDYHRNKSETSVDIKNHIGTSTSAPYHVTWNTSLVPDQSGMKLVARIRGTNGVWFVTDEVTNVTLRRSNASVKLYKASNVPARFSARKTRESKTCSIVIPTTDNLSGATSVKMLITTWNGTNKQALAGETGYTKINSYQFPLFGQDEHWSYNVRDFPVSAIRNGTNTFTVYSNSSGFGISISWPGPALLVRYGSPAPPVGPATKLSIGTQPSNTQAGNSINPPVTVLIQDANGNLVTTETRSVTIALGANPAGGTLAGTKTVSAVGGIATFSNLSIDKSGTGYTLVASASGLTGATTNSFNVTSVTPPQTATKLSFGTQPSGAQPGATITPSVTVRIEDAAGTLVTTDTRSVTVALGSNPGGGTLNGTKTVNAVGGVATFSTLSISNVGNGYTLVASATGLTGATSNAFNITTTPPPPTGNILLNGGFEEGTVEWRHYSNGGTGNGFSVVTDAPVAEGARKAKVTLGSTIGSNNQLYQTALPLEAGKQYHLTFQAYASKATTIQARVIEQNDDYTTYGFPFQTFNLTTGWQTFSVDFTAQNFAGAVNDGMLQFYFVKSSPSTSIYFDNIVLGTETTPPPPAGNIVTNGGFEAGVAPWRFFHNGTGNAFDVVNTAPVAEGTQKGRVVLGSVIGTNNQLYQTGLTLVSGTPYRLTFSAYASKATTFRVRVIEQDEDYTTYGFPFRTISLGTSFQTFTIDFTTGNFAGTVKDAMLQFYFVSSTASTTIFLDNVALAPTSTAASPEVATGSGDGEAVVVEKEASELEVLPTELSLTQNYPNPFNPSTNIDYALPEPSHVTLEVYNVLGERVAVLVDQVQRAGRHTARFEAASLPTGLYLYRLTTGTGMLVKKMMFVK